MSASTNYPTIRPSLLLDFANTEQLDPRITFARSTTATYYDDNTVAKAEENLLLWSQEFDNATWTKSNATVTANATTAPDGTSTADSLFEASPTGSHRIYQLNSSILAPSATTTFSVYLKDFAAPNASQWVRLEVFEGGTTSNQYVANFDLTNGVVGNSGKAAGIGNGVFVSASISSSVNGWYLCKMTYTQSSNAGGASTNAGLYSLRGVGDIANNGSTSFAGDASKGIYIWGAQLEQRSTVTAYTPTTTQPITNYIPVLMTAAINEARLDHNPTTRESLGLLIEESRTNLVTYSEQFDNAAWTKINATVTANTIVAPDGTLTADKLVENTTSGFHSARQGFTVTVGNQYTFSCYAKRSERYLVFTTLYNSTNGVSVEYDLTNGTIVYSGAQGAGYSIIMAPNPVGVGNGWYRIQVTFTVGHTYMEPSITLANSVWTGGNAYTGVNQYIGDGYSGIYIWGAQLEAGSFATSYIPTVLSQVTRSADSASMTGSNFSSWYNLGQGAFYAEAKTAASSLASILQVFGSGQSSNPYGKWDIRYGSATQISTSGALAQTATSGAFNKVCFAYTTFDMANAVNAAAPSTSTSFTLGNMDTLRIAQMIDGFWLNGCIKRIAYYPARLTNAQLQALTS